ncbi:MAG: YbaB/EbfC family nucleoid-associated protein [Alphaproteobacteria bacterium HGW-Alphaproteobacteria-12]|nr:MAG: YbaB/EbfC family nucleoid-associated protein [Alphaproteobacteria bacterium HGW-Alphaproteobacteria-12]
MKNIADIMKQAQQLQSRVTDMQAELEAAQVEGRAGGGLVTITMSGKGEVKKVSIDPSLMKENEREIVEDLIVAAATDAKAKADALAAEKMKAVTGGLPLPPGLGL